VRQDKPARRSVDDWNGAAGFETATTTLTIYWNAFPRLKADR